MPLNELGGLPTRNLQSARFEVAEQISGEIFAEQYLGRRLACSHCPVGCIHIAALREPYEDESYFYKTSMISYDCEPIYALDSMLRLSDPQGFLKLMDQIEILGLDVMSTGVSLAWATEAQERKLISENETNGLKLNWGDHKVFIQAVRTIIEQPNEFYQALAKGVDFASSKYGGQDFALSFGKNEMPGYHTGPGAHLGFLIGARHSHLDNAGYSIDQKELLNRELAPKELAEKLLKEEQWHQILSSLVICYFARGIYNPDITKQALQLTGVELTTDEFSRIGKEILKEKYRFKFREGFSFDNLRIPRRIFETLSPVGKFDEKYMRNVIDSVNTCISQLFEKKQLNND